MAPPPQTLLTGRYAVFIAGGLALLAAALAYVGLAGREKRLDAAWQPISVVVAGKPIAKGQVITREDLEKRDVPRRFLLASHILADEFENSHILGQRTTVDFGPG